MDSCNHQTSKKTVSPAGTPEPIVAKLADAMKFATADADFRESMEKGSVYATSSSPAEFASLMRRHADRWRGLIQRNKISID